MSEARNWPKLLLILLGLAFVFNTAQAKPKKAAPPKNAAKADAKKEQDAEEMRSFSAKDYSSIQSYLEPFVFAGRERRNPFAAPTVSVPLIPGALYGPFLHLQRFRLNQLRVKGLFWNIKKPKALIEDPSGETWTVGIKDYIGEDFGYIASIREKEIVVIQTFEEDGQRYSTTKILFLDNLRSK